MANSIRPQNLDFRPPASIEEWEAYYTLRWKILRAPWSQPRGSERDEFEELAWHLAVFHNQHEIIAVARLHRCQEAEGQLRYMAVEENYRKQGIGSMLLAHMETIARKNHLKRLRLNAREHALPFYLSQGYELVKEGDILFGSIRHFQMVKRLDA